MSIKVEHFDGVKMARVERGVVGGSARFTLKVLAIPCTIPGFRFNVADLREVKNFPGASSSD